MDTVKIDETRILTNKTSTSPNINTPTGIVKGDVGLGNVDDTSDATKHTGTIFTGNVKKSTTNGITAYAGGGQANAVALTSDINEVSVCVTGGDSTKLPAAVAGMEIVVINHGAASMNLFPFSGDFINEGGVDTAASIAIDATAIAYCYIADYWEVVEVGR